MRGSGPLAAMLLGAVVVGCGPWQRVGSTERPQPGVSVPEVFNAAAVYRGMGLLVGDAPLPYVASVRYLAGPTPDSTLVLFALSLANNALSFRRAANEFVAQYRVELTLRRDSGGSRQFARDESVRVPTFQETLRADESVIFQQFFNVVSGSYTLVVLVRDRHGANFARQEQAVTVPSLGQGGLASPVPFYEGSGRQRREELPRLVANPRATLPFGGAESLRVYVEGYALPSGSALAARVVDAEGIALWDDTLTLVGDSALSSVTLLVPPEQLPLGRAQLELALLGAEPRTSLPILLSFSSQWVIANYDAMVELLRYFDYPELVEELRAAAPQDRQALWRAFWKRTDPVPITAENEALSEYFRRVETANMRFGEGSEPGWLSERGEVFITLGDPEEVVDMSSEGNQARGGLIRWGYVSLRLTLFFEDQTGFGKFRLTPASRADYQRVLQRVRRGQ